MPFYCASVIEYVYDSVSLIAVWDFYRSDAFAS